MIGAYTKAFAQLTDGRVLKVIIISSVLAILVYALLIAGSLWAVGQVNFSSIPWLDTAADWGAGFLAVVIATLMFPGILSGVAGIFLDAVADAVERRHYPDLPVATPAPWYDAAFAALRLGGLTIALNLLLLPLYLLFIFFPPLSFALYYAVNGKLLGREYFEIVALRHMDGAAATDMRQRNSGKIWRTGAITAGLLTIPGLNLIAPIIGTAAMVHVFQKLTHRL